MRYPLRYQLLLPFAAAMVCVVGGVTGLNAYLAAGEAQRRSEGQLRAIARALEESNYPLTDAVLRQMASLAGAELVFVDSRGAIVATSFANHDPSSLRHSLAGRSDASHAAVEVAGTRYRRSRIAIEPRGARAASGTLHLLFAEQRLSESRWRAAWPPLAIGAAALALVAALAVGLADRLSRPIQNLSAQVGRLAEGDFQPLPPPRRDDEIKDLVASANSLARRLDELTQAIKQTERLAVLGQLGGGLAHHLRNCLTGAQVAAQWHQRHCEQGDQVSLDVVLRQLSLCENHLRQFLATGGPQSIRRISVCLSSAVAEAVDLVTPACRHRKIRLASDVVSSPAVSGDPDQLRQLLLNLLLNAIDAAGPGGWIRVECEREQAGEIHLRVLDSGPGPPPDLLDRLFEPFATGKPEGIGLGLSVARQIAEAHGGRLRLSNGDSTCFELTLPCDSLATCPTTS